MTPEQRMEEISRAYVAAIAARLGYSVAYYSQDSNCIDLTIAAPGVPSGGLDSDPKIDVQLKATARAQSSKPVTLRLVEQHVKQLRAKASVPKLVVALELPADEEIEAWVEVKHDHLLLRRCAYFVAAESLPECEGGSMTVQFPRENAFTPDRLAIMMLNVSRGEPL